MASRTHLLSACLLTFTIGFSSHSFGFSFPFSSHEPLHEITNQTRNLAPNILKMALSAYEHAKQKGLVDKQIVTIIDYSKPSTEKRLWVVDLKHKKILFNTLVAHGRNSGSDVARKFSNDYHSLTSSLGVFLTGRTYFGHNGYSLVMEGLERGINDKAQARHIVFHPAHYVSEDFIKRTGRIGRSWGCPALSPHIAPQVIDTIKNGTLVFAYYPDKNWLNRSNFLQTI
ncbi:MAG: hypothetical protein K0S11_1463 [Gammaproteobacteria bacterium]|jgi:hypothetical protein|nr:hypothetical protein [Gammaproteobacteria bacterium]